jgi:hypothetical protein
MQSCAGSESARWAVVAPSALRAALRPRAPARMGSRVFLAATELATLRAITGRLLSRTTRRSRPRRDRDRMRRGDRCPARRTPRHSAWACRVAAHLTSLRDSYLAGATDGTTNITSANTPRPRGARIASRTADARRPTRLRHTIRPPLKGHDPTGARAVPRGGVSVRRGAPTSDRRVVASSAGRGGETRDVSPTCLTCRYGNRTSDTRAHTTGVRAHLAAMA